jgi:hypothetical protein
MAHNERGPGPEGVCAPPVEEEDFYSQRLTAKNMTISSTTRANTKSVASSTNGIRLYSPFFPLLGGGVQVCEDEPGTRSGNPVDSLRRGDSGPDRAWQDGAPTLASIRTLRTVHFYLS